MAFMSDLPAEFLLIVLDRPFRKRYNNESSYQRQFSVFCMERNSFRSVLAVPQARIKRQQSVRFQLLERTRWQHRVVL